MWVQGWAIAAGDFQVKCFSKAGKSRGSLVTGKLHTKELSTAADTWGK